MAKRISRAKEDTVMTYETLRQRVISLAEMKSSVMGDFISIEIGIYWRIGQTLAWHAEDLLENLALDLRKEATRSWQARDLAKMVQLYLHYPTVERLSGRCVGRKCDMSLDELLDVGK